MQVVKLVGISGSKLASMSMSLSVSVSVSVLVMFPFFLFSNWETLEGMSTLS